MFEKIEKKDRNALDKLQDIFKCKFLDFLFPKITLMGNGGAIWISVAVCLLFFKKHRLSAIVMLCALSAGASIGNWIFKNVIGRPRPCWREDTKPLLIKMPKDYSFPSGHSLSSFVAASILISTNIPLAIFGLVFATLIAFSRLYLYVHYPSDVILSSVIGVILGRASLLVGNLIAA